MKKKDVIQQTTTFLNKYVKEGTKIEIEIRIIDPWPNIELDHAQETHEFSRDIEIE